MKKYLIFFVVFFLLALLVLSVYLCIEFLGVYQEANEANDPTASATESFSDIESFVQEKWRTERAEYDEKSQSLTLYQSYDLTYEQACAIGGNIFTEDIAPESYFAQIATVAADVTTQFHCPNLLVTMAFVSSDGEVIFSVNSNGDIKTCWE